MSVVRVLLYAYYAFVAVHLSTCSSESFTRRRILGARNTDQSKPSTRGSQRLPRLSSTGSFGVRSSSIFGDRASSLVNSGSSSDDSDYRPGSLADHELQTHGKRRAVLGVADQPEPLHNSRFLSRLSSPVRVSGRSPIVTGDQSPSSQFNINSQRSDFDNGRERSPIVMSPLSSSQNGERVRPMPAPVAGKLRIFVLPVGQGDGHVIQCPDGDLIIVDLGTSSPESRGFWRDWNIRSFLGDHYNRLTTVILTHIDYDHYSLIPDVLKFPPTSLERVYLSCRPTANRPGGRGLLPFSNWLNNIEGRSNVIQMSTDGQACGVHLTKQCRRMPPICPRSRDAITVDVIASNLGNCAAGNANEDSIVFKVTFGGHSVMFNGDFQGNARKSFYNELSRQTRLDHLQSTILKLPHHGAYSTDVESYFQAHAPRAAFVSADTWHPLQYRHPRCATIEKVLPLLCRPGVGNMNDPSYCRGFDRSDMQINRNVAHSYTCGRTPGRITVAPVAHALYTTQPDESSMNVVQIELYSGRWKILNNVMDRFVRPNTQPT